MGSLNPMQASSLGIRVTVATWLAAWQPNPRDCFKPNQHAIVQPSSSSSHGRKRHQPVVYSSSGYSSFINHTTISLSTMCKDMHNYSGNGALSSYKSIRSSRIWMWKCISMFTIQSISQNANQSLCRKQIWSPRPVENQPENSRQQVTYWILLTH